MTRITKLYMKGFKSFAKPTNFDFTHGFNCILGPNGAGKSNVLDALCFVLGRSSAKSLRVEKSANLIYNGGPTKKAMDKGEVSIFFDNSKSIFPIDTKEIKVSRIVKNNGQSIYKINDKTCSRTEIRELMGNARIDPDGYNIVLQGDIIRLCEMHPVERRKVIEEVSNISQYEDKKQKALNELNKVDEKLNEADIVLKERKTRLKELEKERDQAIKYKHAEQEIKLSKAAYIKQNFTEKDSKYLKLNENIKQFQEKIDTINEKIKINNDNINQHRTEIEKLNAEINEKSEKEQVSIHKEIEDTKVEIATNNSKLTNINSNIEKLNERISQLKDEKEVLNNELGDNKKEIQSTKDMIKDFNVQLKEVEDKLSKIRAKSNEKNIEEIENELNLLDKEIEDHQKVIQEITQKQQNLFREKDQVEFKLENIDKQIMKIKEVEKEHKAQLNDLKKFKGLFKETTLELNEKLNKDSDFGAQIGNAKTKMNIVMNDLSKLEQKQLQLMQSSANSEAMKEINELKKKTSGIHGTLGTLGKVNSRYAQALETAAGNKLNYFVVDDDSVAVKCINHLKSKRAGSASFIPLNKVKSSQKDADSKILKMSGVHGYALDLIKFNAKYAKAFAYAFGSAIVVDDLNIAKKAGIGNNKFVTLDGDIAEKSGIMKGGYKQKKQSVFQLSELTEEIEKLNSQIGEFQSVIENLQHTRLKNENDIVSLRHKKSELEAEIIKLEKSLHLSDNDLDASSIIKKELSESMTKVDKELSEVRQEMQKHSVALAQLKSKKEMARAKIGSMKNPRIIAELNAYDEKKSKLKEQLIRAEAQLNNFNSTKELKEKEIEKTSEILKQHDKEIKQFNESHTSISKQIKDMQKDLKEKEKSAKAFYDKYKELFSRRQKLDKDIIEIEKKNESFRDESKTHEIKSNMLSLELAKINTEISALQEQLQEYNELMESKAEELEKKMKKSREDLKKEVVNFERTLNNLGLVNLKALEIYDSVENEYNTLTQKRETLSEEKTKVLTLINEIETKKTEMFMEAYDRINNDFKEIFKMLAPKGEANLVIENPKDIFEAGLAIKVKLGEKKTMDIRSLSGGEKTLTALSFIFAIQEYQPHSFYILDEVDAALDKYNSEKLAKLIRKYTGYAQYVIISHNDAIMSEADALFGVSMDKHNVSKVTSMKM